MIVFATALLLLPLTAGSTNNNNASAQPGTYDPGYFTDPAKRPHYLDDNPALLQEMYQLDLLLYRNMMALYQDQLQDYQSCLDFRAKYDKSNLWPNLCQVPKAPKPPTPPTTLPRCATGQRNPDGSCVPTTASCASGKRNPDGSCVPPPCRALAPNERDRRYDPNQKNKNLDDPHVNPEMKFHLENAINDFHDSKYAKDSGITLEIGEVYRTPERSDRLYDDYINGRGSKANPAWESAHNYGLGVDLIIKDKNGTPIEAGDNYKPFRQLAASMKAEGFLWYDDYVEGGGDAGHFEYHPQWDSNLIIGPFIKPIRDEAMKQAATEGGYNLPADPMSVDWLQKLWNKAGAPCSP